MEFSTSALIDGVIHLAAFLVVCGILYGYLLLIARSKFERNFFRTIFLVASLVTARLYLLQVGWATTVLVVVILLLLSTILLVGVLKTDLIVTIITPFILVPLFLGMERAAFSISNKVIPDGSTYAEFYGRSQSAIEQSRKTADANTTDAGLRDIARRDLDSFASFTTKRETGSIKEDSSRGISLFAERKQWMDSLTPAEKQAYCAEMSTFLAEQGLADDRYSLQAIREVNPTNLVVLASLFDELQNEETAEEERIRSIPASLAVIAANLRGMDLSADDLDALRRFSELFAKNEIEEAIAKARKDLEDSGGTDKLAGFALAAMVQSKSGLPMDQLIVDVRETDMFTRVALRSSSERTNLLIEAEEVPVDVGKVEPIPADESKPFVEISCPLGVVRIPSDSSEMDDWIVASQALEIKGYASLGGEVAILRKDGSVCVKGDDLTLEYADLIYHFRVVSVVRDRAALQAEYIEMRDSALNRFY